MYFYQKVEENVPVQWLLLAGWSGLILSGISRQKKSFLLSGGLVCAMGTQLLLLGMDGMLTWQDALPLHLCSLFGCLLVPMLRCPPACLMEAVCFLGAPGAFLTLFFPAVVRCSHPFLMQLAFYQLHVLVALAPLYWYANGKPLPVHPHRTLILGSGYLVFISLFNRLFGTNYLFLQAVPQGTPLEWLFRPGRTFFLCALVMLCMLVFAWLKGLYAYLRK